jgi:predicted ferric reductase
MTASVADERRGRLARRPIARARNSALITVQTAMRSASAIVDALDTRARAGDAPMDALTVESSLALDDRAMARGLVRIFAARGERAVRPSALRSALEALDASSPEARIDFVFDLFDEDLSGAISPAEFSKLIDSALGRANLVLARGWLDAMTEAVFARADRNGDRTLSRDEFRAFVAEDPALEAAFSGPVLSWLGAKASRRASAASREGPLRRARAWVDERGASAITAAVAYVSVTVGAFLYAALEYRARGAHEWVQLARGFGRVIDVHLVLVVLLVLRREWTAARRTRAGRLVPIDDFVGAHRVAAWTMLAASIAHTAAHCANYARNGTFTTVWTTSVAAATGLALLLVFAVIAAFARDAVRRSGRFEVFRAAHKLAYVFYAVALFHAPGLVPWVAAIAALWAIEHLWRRRALLRTRALWIEPLPSGVTRLEVATPKGFTFRAGDYVFVRVRAIAEDEWHPFTISSAPETQGALTLHIRSVGNWTRALNALARDRAAGAAAAQFDVELDGPYGAPTSERMDAKVPVLVGAGIGVTPFASVLESIRLRARRGLPVPERVYFFWLVREQQSFEWFAERLCTIEREDAEGRFVLRVFVTSVSARDGAGPWLAAALDALRSRVGRDALTGLRSATGLEAPQWERELGAIARDHGADACVYFCGPEGLADSLRTVCAKVGIAFQQEHF